jgi:nucleotide-diphospho-sugar transferase
MPSDPLVITFADSGYQPLLAIWVAQLRALGIKRLRVYALDHALLDWCCEHEVDAVELAWQGDLRDLWVQRIRIFSALLGSGEAFVHSDVDAIWVRNPLCVGAATDRHEDLLFSQGTVWPPDVHGRWGFVLCCGWFRALPTQGARQFFSALEHDVRVSGDDQISVNRLLSATPIRWDISRAPDYRLDFNGKALPCWASPIHGENPDASLSVALLPHCEFQRLPENSYRAVVKHYLTPKNCEQKLQVMRHYGLIPA